MPATHQKKLQGEQSRRRLIDAAMRLISEGGYAGTSVDAVATEAGVVKSALYWHFGSKRGLLEVALNQACAGWLDDLDAAVAGTIAPLERLDRVLDLMRSLIVERPEIRRMLCSLLLERTDDAACREAIANTLDHLKSRVAQCLSGPEALSPSQAEDMADRLMCWCDGLFLRHLANPDVEALDRGLRRVRATLAREALEILREPIRDQFTPPPLSVEGMGEADVGL